MATQRAAAGAGAPVLALVVLAAALAVPAVASPPKQKFTPAGNAAAKAVVVKLADLPAGFKVTRGGGGGAGVTCSKFNPKQSDLTQIGKASTAFESSDGLVNIASLAGVFASTAQAQASWDRIAKPALLNCLASIVESVATQSTTVTVASKGRHALKVPGRRAAAYRIVADVKAGAEQAKIYLDVIMQGGGRADTVLMVTSVAAPPAAALEKKLAAAIAGRLPR
jgi:hypothetical protein